MDIKDWILIGGSILLAAVVIHGFWVAWSNRRDTLKMAIDRNIPREEVDDLLLLRAELPNGGARPKSELASGRTDPNLEPRTPRQGKPQQSSMFGESTAQVESTPLVTQRSVEREANEDFGRKKSPQTRSRAKPKSTRHEKADDTPVQTPQEILVISVLGRNGQSFPGNELMQVFMRNGLKFGDMNIFHRLDVTTKAVQFSIVSVVEPGSFDLSNMDEFDTPGISFFMKLPGPDEPMAAFEDMLGVARDVARSLGGDLKDEQMGVITSQTIEHLKQRITDFSRKRMSQRA